MILEHFDELEADFTRFYRIDLPEAIWGPAPMSARRISVLIKGLPPGESAVGRALNPQQDWGFTEELLALLNEQIDVSNRLFYKVHAEKGAREPEPLQVRRPGQQDKPRRQMSSTGELVRFFGRAGQPGGAR